MKNAVEFLLKRKDIKSDEIFCQDMNEKYTYGQAIEIAKKIACFFRERGIQKSPIMFKAEHNCKSILCMLGIILSNNHYVPVNPTFSDEKIEMIRNSAHINYEIIFEKDTKSACQTFLFENLNGGGIDDDVIKTLESQFDENNLIYTLFTSGSTGVPKGVAKTHKNVISFVNNFCETFNFKNKLRIASQAPFFFDASMKDVYLALAKGSLFIPDKTTFAMPLKLVEYLNQNEINYICWVPSALSIVVRLGTFKYVLPKFLQYVFFVGEVFPIKYLNIWVSALPNVTFANLYGSTEVAGVCLYEVIDKELPIDAHLPLGKPIKNNQVFLEDGEIVIISDQIACGYINDEAKNKEVFVERNGSRALKTGDFAFVDEEGKFVFSTRKDFQIKHMGYRIELQEIEVYLNALKYVSGCAVVFNQENDKITAFVTLNQTLEEPVKQVISDLKTKLPTYMIPNRVVVLKELPLNANGKIDRVKLKQAI